MWVLRLNDMRSPKSELLQSVAKSESKEELIAFVQAEMVPTWRDGQWAKSFAKGGPLEWFNLPWDSDSGQHYMQVSHDDPHLRLVVDVREVVGRQPPSNNPMTPEGQLRRKLAWLARQEEEDLGAPVWLGALVAIFQAVPVDSDEEEVLARLIDRIEKDRDIESEEFYEKISSSWRWPLQPGAGGVSP